MLSFKDGALQRFVHIIGFECETRCTMSCGVPRTPQRQHFSREHASMHDLPMPEGSTTPSSRTEHECRTKKSCDEAPDLIPLVIQMLAKVVHSSR
eukprot:scaffold37560_cov35-Tisochrysis_lutea.AAC.1